LDQKIEISGKKLPSSSAILTDDALSFVAALHRKFNATREQLLARRATRQREFDAGKMPDFLPETKSVRDGDWKVAATPPDLQKRWVEITGPVERKMMINAFNSGANIFMADFEDSLSPTWENVVDGQQNLIDAVRRKIEFTSPEGKSYRLNPEIAVLLVRPRGWHLTEKHITVDGQPISASILDFGLYFFHNARELQQQKSGPYFYLPKMESHLEARLWNDVFNAAQDALKIPRGTIRATVLVETLPAAFEMDEILYELRDHASGLNAGRWDYIFSLIKKFRNRADLALPDRVQVTMTVPFMRSYTELLVRTCHRRGAHAMGGMAPFIPNRKNPEINEKALAKVREDKMREAGDGFDGTWVAHPDLVPVAMEVFQKALGQKANQKDRLREEVKVAGSQLVDTHVPGGTITEAGFRNNISVALQYLNSWLSGNGAVAIFNLMEDAATAEISRAQLWQWITNRAKLDDGTVASRELYERIRDEELSKLGGRDQGRMREAVELLDSLVLSKEFSEFLTLPAYRLFE
jgi:malate synthase